MTAHKLLEQYLSNVQFHKDVKIIYQKVKYT